MNYEERGSKHNSAHVYPAEHLPTLLLSEFTSAARNTERISGVLRLHCPHVRPPASGSTGLTQHSWLQLRDCLTFISKLLSNFNQAGYWGLFLSKENVLNSGGLCCAYKGKHLALDNWLLIRTNIFEASERDWRPTEKFQFTISLQIWSQFHTRK